MRDAIATFAAPRDQQLPIKALSSSATGRNPQRSKAKRDAWSLSSRRARHVRADGSARTVTCRATTRMLRISSTFARRRAVVRTRVRPSGRRATPTGATTTPQPNTRATVTARCPDAEMLRPKRPVPPKLRRRVAATLRRGYSVETSRGAAAGATRIFRRVAPRRGYSDEWRPGESQDDSVSLRAHAGRGKSSSTARSWTSTARRVRARATSPRF